MRRVALSPDVSISRVAYGMWRLGADADTSPARVRAKVESCLAQGVTTMDQADIYGGYAAEALLGAALREAPGLRERIEIVTKCGIVAPVGRHAAARVKHYDTGRAHVVAAVETSLRAMATDRIDLLLIHRPDPLIDPDETGACLDELVASGKVRAVGVSNFRPHDLSLLQSRTTSRLVANQIELGLLATGPFVDGDLAYLHERRIVPMAWSPLGGGRLFSPENARLLAALERVGAEAGVDASAVATAFLLAHPAGIVPVVGTNDLDRIGRIGSADGVVLDRQTWFELYTLAIGREVP